MGAIEGGSFLQDQKGSTLQSNQRNHNTLWINCVTSLYYFLWNKEHYFCAYLNFLFIYVTTDLYLSKDNLKFSKINNIEASNFGIILWIDHATNSYQTSYYGFLLLFLIFLQQIFLWIVLLALLLSFEEKYQKNPSQKKE